MSRSRPPTSSPRGLSARSSRPRSPRPQRHSSTSSRRAPCPSPSQDAAAATAAAEDPRVAIGGADIGPRRIAVMRTSIANRDLAALVGAAACWGVGTVISKAALEEVPPLTLLPIQLAASLAGLLALIGSTVVHLRK